MRSTERDVLLVLLAISAGSVWIVALYAALNMPREVSEVWIEAGKGRGVVRNADESAVWR